MRERQPSIADALMTSHGQALLDGRYRLDALVRRSATATIHVATHRNGSTAWLKMPVSRDVQATAEMFAREASVTNTIGSRLVVRDDGRTRDGIPYLVLDPPEAESVATLRARARSTAPDARLPLARVMTLGDALARITASIHALGFVLGGLEDEDILVFANGDVALLDLHALSPRTQAGVAADVARLLRALYTLVSEVAESNVPAGTRAAIGGALAASYPDVAALQASWRAASPEPIAPPARLRQGSLADASSARVFAASAAPGAFSATEPGPGFTDVPPKDPDGSVIGFLRSGSLSAMPPAPAALGPRERPLMYDPLSRMVDMPRLVTATSRHAAVDGSAPARRSLLLAAVVGPPLLALAAVMIAFVATSGPDTPRRVAGEERSATATATAKSAATVMPTALVTTEADAAVDEELQLETSLRTDGAPPDRDVFVDGKKVGKTPLQVMVPCGHHTLQMVAGAPLQSVELPCGGVRIVRYDAKGHWSLKAE
ncbi:MAG: serine/threonine protein kinase [Myxococcaceae bacterium]|nr:serine/threonine protein kinase [Myxococcaceae bacterium]